MYSQSSVRLPSSERRRALLLQTSAHPERGQAGGGLVRTSTHTHTHTNSCLREVLLSALVNHYSLFRWRGDYGGKKQLWFPANYVEELPSSPLRELDEAVSSSPDHTNTVRPSSIIWFFSSPQSTENSPLGTFLKGFLDVTSCHVGEFNNA